MDRKKFEEVFQQGRRANGRFARLCAQPGTGELGLTTARSIGSHARRNRARRRLREAWRAAGPWCSRDAVVVGLPSSLGAKLPDIVRDIEALRARIESCEQGTSGSP
ncbi:MAG: ribonuclease P protein component [Fimbriimonadaceae bacterium]